MLILFYSQHRKHPLPASSHGCFLWVSLISLLSYQVLSHIDRAGNQNDESFDHILHVHVDGQDVDIVLTTREFVRMIRAEHINTRFLKEQAFDSPLGESTGAGVIFGVTGGVMEAALRTAYAVVEGKNPEADAFRAVRGRDGRREADFTLGDQTLHTCTVSGLANAEKLMEDIKAGRVSYDFVEVMACPGGCVGGGGQPIHDGCEFAERRGGTLYRLDSERKLRFSHENPEVQEAVSVSASSF